MRFKIGDIVVGNSKSDIYYGVTCKSDGFLGKITEVISDTRIKVKIIKHKYSNYIGDCYRVDADCFAKVSDNLRTVKELKNER